LPASFDASLWWSFISERTEVAKRKTPPAKENLKPPSNIRILLFRACLGVGMTGYKNQTDATQNAMFSKTQN
jgi:uncharacterized membrane protein